MNGPTAVATMGVNFTSGPASTDGSTGGDAPPVARGYDVANTDFFGDLNRFITKSGEKFSAVDPRKVITNQQSLAGITSLVLADDPLPGYTGSYVSDPQKPTGPPTADKQFESSASVPGAGERVPGTYETYEFTIGPNDSNGSMDVKIDWDIDQMDFDLYVYKKNEDGTETEVNHSAGGTPQTSEEVKVPNPAAGDYIVYVDNWAAPDPQWRGTVTFTPATDTSGDVPSGTGTGAFTPAEKNNWFAKLGHWVSRGGNLVLTDGALRALPELVPMPTNVVRRTTVYAGGIAFSTPTQTTTRSTTRSPPTCRRTARAGAAAGGARPTSRRRSGTRSRTRRPARTSRTPASTTSTRRPSRPPAVASRVPAWTRARGTPSPCSTA